MVLDSKHFFFFSYKNNYYSHIFDLYEVYLF